MRLKRQLIEGHLAELDKAEGADPKHRQAYT
jgi:hypothetical protein